MTLKHLLQTYSTAYNRIDGNKETYMCIAIRNVDFPQHDFCASLTDYIKTNYKELVLFCPDDELLNSGFNWTDCVTKSEEVARDIRRTILAFCIAMCED